MRDGDRFWRNFQLAICLAAKTARREGIDWPRFVVLRLAEQSYRMVRARSGGQRASADSAGRPRRSFRFMLTPLGHIRVSDVRDGMIGERDGGAG